MIRGDLMKIEVRLGSLSISNTFLLNGIEYLIAAIDSEKSTECVMCIDQKNKEQIWLDPGIYVLVDLVR